MLRGFIGGSFLRSRHGPTAVRRSEVIFILRRHFGQPISTSSVAVVVVVVLVDDGMPLAAGD